MDSLIAAELRNWFNMAFGADIGMLDLLDTRNTMRTLAATVVAAAFHREVRDSLGSNMEGESG